MQRKALLGTKLGMSQVWDEQGRVIPVTLVDVSTNVVTDVKTTDKNGYIDFRGFFGEYEGEIDGMEFDFEIHKNDNNRWEILV